MIPILDPSLYKLSSVFCSHLWNSRSLDLCKLDDEKIKKLIFVEIFKIKEEQSTLLHNFWKCGSNVIGYFNNHKKEKEKENTATVLLTIIQYIQVSRVELEIPRVMFIVSGELWQAILFWIFQLHRYWQKYIMKKIIVILGQLLSI